MVSQPGDADDLKLATYNANNLPPSDQLHQCDELHIDHHRPPASRSSQKDTERAPEYSG